MPVYFRWSLMGQTSVSRPRVCGQLLPGNGLSRSKREDSIKQPHACGGSHVVPGATPLPRFLPVDTRPCSPSEGPSASSSWHLSWLPSVTSPCGYLPAAPLFWQQPVSDGLPTWQNPRKGHGRQWLRDLGKLGKVLQRGNLGGQRHSKAQGPSARGRVMF